MLSLDNREFETAAVADPDDITIGDLLGFLAAHKDNPLVFLYGGRPVKAGYHVTEVKAGQFAALDCGANPESWTEIFVQLWDVNEGEGRFHMLAGKFSDIIRKVTEHLSLDHTARLTFEVSDGVAPIELHRAALPVFASGKVHVELSPRPASCKPRDRWLDMQKKVSGCCEPGAQSCCG